MTISTLALRSVCAVNGADALSRDRWPFTVPSVRAVLAEGLDFAPLTVIVGENGAGKSVLVEALAVVYGLPVEGGTSWDQRESAEGESLLARWLQPVRGAAKSREGLFFRAETVHSLVSYRVLAGSDMAPRYFRQSHGESVLEMVEAARSRGGLWIFDEPESGLSFNGQLRLIALIMEHLEAGHQVILCTHSPLLMQVPGARVLEVGGCGMRPVNVEDLEMLMHWKTFLDAPGRYLRHL
ncbi:AAA family ATPase [Rothia sp. ZJ1223]|uniref:AAA family ATPase n=1 Tax=Rothia sp. ZJ1223 TaxID=2811098 RepID=UPI0019595E34|nr:AAA family ATPase [Rothia sp. ZJ1223]MBM7051794.1 AAA family ATPase [Rothia sp. ZJ1223]